MQRTLHGRMLMESGLVQAQGIGGLFLVLQAAASWSANLSVHHGSEHQWLEGGAYLAMVRGERLRKMDGRNDPGCQRARSGRAHSDGREVADVRLDGRAKSVATKEGHGEGGLRNARLEFLL